jgi:hypothetical protein
MHAGGLHRPGSHAASATSDAEAEERLELQHLAETAALNKITMIDIVLRNRFESIFRRVYQGSFPSSAGASSSVKAFVSVYLTPAFTDFVNAMVEYLLAFVTDTAQHNPSPRASRSLRNKRLNTLSQTYVGLLVYSRAHLKKPHSDNPFWELVFTFVGVFCTERVFVEEHLSEVVLAEIQRLRRADRFERPPRPANWKYASVRETRGEAKLVSAFAKLRSPLMSKLLPMPVTDYTSQFFDSFKHRAARRASEMALGPPETAEVAQARDTRAHLKQLITRRVYDTKRFPVPDQPYLHSSPRKRTSTSSPFTVTSIPPPSPTPPANLASPRARRDHTEWPPARTQPLRPTQTYEYLHSTTRPLTASPRLRKTATANTYDATGDKRPSNTSGKSTHPNFARTFSMLRTPIFIPPRVAHDGAGLNLHAMTPFPVEPIPTDS